MKFIETHEGLTSVNLITVIRTNGNDVIIGLRDRDAITHYCGNYWEEAMFSTNFVINEFKDFLNNGEDCGTFTFRKYYDSFEKGE